MLRKLALAFSLITASGQFHSAVAEPFHEEAYVPIGGAQQWITIHSANIENPVLLVLHGGPGDAIIRLAARKRQIAIGYIWFQPWP